LKVEYFEDVGTKGIEVSWLATSEIAGNAVEFDGTDDYVELPFILDPGAETAFTAEMWFKTDLSDTKLVLLDQSDSDVFFYIASNKVGSYLGRTNLFSTSTLTVGAWLR